VSWNPWFKLAAYTALRYNLRLFKPLSWEAYKAEVGITVVAAQYVIVIMGETNKYAFKIKDRVEQASLDANPASSRSYSLSKANFSSKQLESLYEHPDCTQYLHDLLDLIQSRMLFIESDEPRLKRIKAPELLKETKRMREQCKEKEYCMVKCPRPSTHNHILPLLLRSIS
jgi:hypothetical protein